MLSFLGYQSSEPSQTMGDFVLIKPFTQISTNRVHAGQKLDFVNKVIAVSVHGVPPLLEISFHLFDEFCPCHNGCVRTLLIARHYCNENVQHIQHFLLISEVHRRHGSTAGEKRNELLEGNQAVLVWPTARGQRSERE